MTWGDLTKRQQHYLQAIYEVDQENERHEKSQWSRGGRSRPASEWRWMFYGIQSPADGDSPLRRSLNASGLVDTGTGSTFKALEKRGYIQCRYPHPGTKVLDIQITPKGRKLVREASEKASERPPIATLRQWHWKALAEAWKGRPEGLRSKDGYYGRISWNTWLRLRDYKARGEARPLVEEYRIWGEYNPRLKYTPHIYWIRLSAFGEQYYRDNWQRYHELYPGVDAPHPDTSTQEESSL